MNSPLRSLAQKNVQPLRLVIVEDDLDHYIILKRIVSKQFPHLSIVGHCESVQELSKDVAAVKPDILLLDIQLRGGTALETLTTMTERCFDFIVISAQRHFRYAQEALRLGASDYIPKPYEVENLVTALQKVIAKRTSAAQAAAELLEMKQQLQDKAANSVPTPNATEVLCLRDGQRTVVVPIANVSYVEADRCHVFVYTIEGKRYRHREQLGKFSLQLEGHNFLQTHKSYLVALKHIEALVPEFAVVRSEDKHEKKIPIARRYASEVKQAWLAYHTQ
jgi:two-component system LytT family response regulator